MSREPVLPAPRAAIFAAVCLALAAGAHAAMSGASIPAWALVLGGLGVYLPARLGAGRERGLLAIAALMGVLQIALHLLFDYAQRAGEAASPVPGVTNMPRSTSMPGMVMAPGTTMAGMPGMTGTAAATTVTHASHLATTHAAATGAVTSAMDMSTRMLLAHALAAVVCAWWLRRGEVAVHAVVRGATHWVIERTTVPARPRPPMPPRLVRAVRTVHSDAVALILQSQWLRTTRALRGPPAAPASIAR